jgi:hypothetical protein
MARAIFMRLAHVDDRAGFVRDDSAEIFVLDRWRRAAAGKFRQERAQRHSSFLSS